MALLISNGQGGYDMSGLPYWCAWLGVTDMQSLMQRLAILKLHRPEKESN